MQTQGNTGLAVSATENRYLDEDEIANTMTVAASMLRMTAAALNNDDALDEADFRAARLTIYEATDQLERAAGDISNTNRRDYKLLDLMENFSRVSAEVNRVGRVGDVSAEEGEAYYQAFLALVDYRCESFSAMRNKVSFFLSDEGLFDFLESGRSELLSAFLSSMTGDSGKGTLAETVKPAKPAPGNVFHGQN